jgi:hypothetical protein
MPDDQPVTRTARETGSAVAREHTAPPTAAGRGRYAARRGAPGVAGATGGFVPVPGRTGVTFGYMNWWIIMVL